MQLNITIVAVWLWPENKTPHLFAYHGHIPHHEAVEQARKDAYNDDSILCGISPENLANATTEHLTMPMPTP
jgi:uncharacterized CHY-type Zn-finger protein